MTKQDLQDRIWGDLPFVRKHLIGRERYDDLFAISIEQCPVEFCQHVSGGSVEADVVIAAWEQSVRRGYCLVYGDEAQFGPLFWILIGPIVQLMLKKLLEWWFESSRNRALMAKWRGDT